MTTYRNNGPWGAGKGAPLTSMEADLNFWDIIQRLTNLETAPSEAPITNITVDGGVMTITVAGGEEFEVPLPVATFNPRGDWAHPNHYNFMDVVNVPGQGGYLVLQDHDTVAPFDPNRTIGGVPVYQLVFNPGAAGAPGTPGAPGAAGPPGPTGYFKIDVEADFASRDAYDMSDPGFVFISNNGEDGLGGLPVMYIMGEGSAGNWTGPFAWGQPEGPAGPIGPAGPPGSNSDWDATGTYAERSAHDAAAAGFVYLSTNGDGGATTNLAQLFIRETATAGVWSDGIDFQGPAGPIGPAGPVGPQGPAGPAGANADWDASGTFAQRSTYDAQPQGFTFLSTNGDGATVTDASLYIKASATAGDWGPRIPFQGPKGNTGPPGPAGPGGPAGSAGVGVPAGGSTGQVLAKSSNANFATVWTAPSGGGGSSLPPITPGTDEGKVLSVVGGAPGWQSNLGPAHDLDAGPLPDAADYFGRSLFVYGVLGGTMAYSDGVDWVLGPAILSFALSDEQTAIAAATGVVTFIMPFKMKVNRMDTTLGVVSSSGSVSVDCKMAGTSIFSTLPSIDAGEQNSQHGVVGVVSNRYLARDSKLTFDIVSAGTGAKGLKVSLAGFHIIQDLL